MAQEHDPEIIREDRGCVRLLLLNRSPSNSLSSGLLEALSREIAAAESDQKVRSLLIASSSPKYFSSGLDLDEMLALPGQKRGDLLAKLVESHRRLAAARKPTVAAIQGYALLGGFVLALGCDWRLLCEETGRVSLGEVRLGLSPTTPVIRLVLALTGRPGLVKELILQGKTLRSREAFEAGLVDRLLPGEGFLEEAIKEAERLSRLAPNAYASIKRSIRDAFLGREEELWEQGRQELVDLLSGGEAQEGMSAMKEKRKPRWE